MEMKICVDLVLLTILTVSNCSEKIYEDLCLDCFCGKRFIGLQTGQYSELFSKTCVMNQILKINFNVTFRENYQFSLTQTSTNGSLFLDIPTVVPLISLYPLIVDTRLGAIMKIKYVWSYAPLVLLPVQKLGTEYFFGGYAVLYSKFVFVAVDNNTLVHLYYNKTSSAEVFVNGNPINDTMFDDTHVVRLDIDSMDVIHIAELGNELNRYHDRIISNNAFAAFWFSTSDVGDWLSIQIKSVGMLGKVYFVYYPPPFFNVSVIKVIATQAATLVTVSAHGSLVLAKAECASYFLKPHDSMFVSADKPILVFFIFSSINGIELPILAKEQFSTEYLLDLPPGKTTMFLVLPHGAAQLKGVKFNVSEMSERNIGHTMITVMLVTLERIGVIVELSTNQQFGGLSVTASDEIVRLKPTSIECKLRRINREYRLQTCPSAVCNSSAAKEVCEAPQLLPNTEETSLRSRENIVIGMTVLAIGVIVTSAIVAGKYLKKHHLNRVRPQH